MIPKDNAFREFRVRKPRASGDDPRRILTDRHRAL